MTLELEKNVSSTEYWNKKKQNKLAREHIIYGLGYIKKATSLYMKRLNFFREYPHGSIHEQEMNLKAQGKNEPSKFDCSTNHSSTSYEYHLKVEDETVYMIRVDKKTGAVHMFVAEQFLDFDNLNHLYKEWPQLTDIKELNTAFRSMLLRDGLELKAKTNTSNDPGGVNEQEYPRYDERCGEDCVEYRFTIGPNSFEFRIDPDSKMCSLQTNYPERTFHLDDIFDKVPELSMILRGSLLFGLRRRLEGDGFKMPDTPDYEVGYIVTNKE